MRTEGVASLSLRVAMAPSTGVITPPAAPPPPPPSSEPAAPSSSTFVAAAPVVAPARVLWLRAKQKLQAARPIIPTKMARLTTTATPAALHGAQAGERRHRRGSAASLRHTALRDLLDSEDIRPPHDAGAARRCSIVWFRGDLRLHDHEALHRASAQSEALLPVFCFDPRDFPAQATTTATATTRPGCSGRATTGPCRAAFLLQSVKDLRAALQARGSDLIVRVGKPEDVLPRLAKQVGARALFFHKEVTLAEVRAEQRVARALQAEGVRVQGFWGSTLFHQEDLPFADLRALPPTYRAFRERMSASGVAVRALFPRLSKLRALPALRLDPGDLPTLAQLGLREPQQQHEAAARSRARPAEGHGGETSALRGGESEALQRLGAFLARAKRRGGGAKGAGQPAASAGALRALSASAPLGGADFSCRISPWLATGCLSPRELYHKVDRELSRRGRRKEESPAATPPAASADWVLFELMWRDFFRFVTRKHSEQRLKLGSAKAPTARTAAVLA